MLHTFLTILIIGGLFLLAFIKFTNAISVNRKANAYFGIFLLLWSTFWLDDVIVINNTLMPFLHFIQFFTPISFYLSIVFYTNPQYRFKARDSVYAIVPLVFAVLLLIRSLLPAQLFNRLFLVLFLTHALFYTILAYIRLNRHEKNIETFTSSKEPVSLHWLKSIIYILALSAVLSIIYNIIDTSGSLNDFINLFYVATVYFVAYHSLKQQEIYPKGYAPENAVTEAEAGNVATVDSKKKVMENAELDAMKRQLLTLMETQQPYLESDLTLVKLAEQLHISAHQLSYLINTGFDDNFFVFINRYRVEKAKALLTNPKYAQLTILAIGFEAGFNSKTSFNTTFKKLAGETPSAYRQIHSGL